MGKYGGMYNRRCHCNGRLQVRLPSKDESSQPQRKQDALHNSPLRISCEDPTSRPQNRTWRCCTHSHLYWEQSAEHFLMCQELNAEGESLLFHTDVRWLSRRNVVARVATLEKGLKNFFDRNEKKLRKFVNKFSDNRQTTKLVHLNIFSHINAIKRSLQCC